MTKAELVKAIQILENIEHLSVDQADAIAALKEHLDKGDSHGQKPDVAQIINGITHICYEYSMFVNAWIWHSRFFVYCKPKSEIQFSPEWFNSNVFFECLLIHMRNVNEFFRNPHYGIFTGARHGNTLKAIDYNPNFRLSNAEQSYLIETSTRLNTYLCHPSASRVSGKQYDWKKLAIKLLKLWQKFKTGIREEYREYFDCAEFEIDDPSALFKDFFQAIDSERLQP